VVADGYSLWTQPDGGCVVAGLRNDKKSAHKPGRSGATIDFKLPRVAGTTPELCLLNCEHCGNVLEALALEPDGKERQLGLFLCWWDGAPQVRPYTLRCTNLLGDLTAQDELKLRVNAKEGVAQLGGVVLY